MEELVSVKELCKQLKVSRVWLYRAAKKGLIPCYRMGDLVRFRQRDIDAFLEKSRMEGGENTGS